MTQLYDYQIAVQRAGNFLLNEIKEDGAFVYERTIDGAVTPAAYNMLRHCGTVWALALASDCLYSEIYNSKLPLALNFIKQQIVACSAAETNESFSLVLDKKHAKLGGNALALLALLTLKQESQLQSDLLAGVRFFLHPETGAVRFSKFNPYTGKISAFQSEYYPGEAALALAVAGSYGLAIALVRQVWDNRDKAVPLQDHWMLQALEVLYSKAQSYADTLALSTEELQDELFAYAQQIMFEIKQNPVYLGRCTPTACRAEASVAYLGILAQRPADSHLQQMYAFTVSLLNLVLTYQLTQGPFKGAFVDEGRFRIDYTQHAMTALYRFLALPHTKLQEV